jgi:hypothetical protein
VVARKQADADERAERSAADEGLDKRIADLAVGGLRVQRFGVAAFVVGIIFATVPDELANLLRWMF